MELCVVFFFVKQKTAYERRISDWSSDVCSSDLLEGGSIAELRVREGDRVRAGQLLMRLDNLEAKALHAVLEGQYVALAAQEARLQAESESLGTLAFPAALEAQRDRREVGAVLDRDATALVSGRPRSRGQAGGR